MGRHTVRPPAQTTRAQDDHLRQVPSAHLARDIRFEPETFTQVRLKHAVGSPAR